MGRKEKYTFLPVEKKSTCREMNITNYES